MFGAQRLGSQAAANALEFKRLGEFIQGDVVIPVDVAFTDDLHSTLQAYEAPHVTTERNTFAHGGGCQKKRGKREKNEKTQTGDTVVVGGEKERGRERHREREVERQREGGWRLVLSILTGAHAMQMRCSQAWAGVWALQRAALRSRRHATHAVRRMVPGQAAGPADVGKTPAVPSCHPREREAPRNACWALTPQPVDLDVFPVQHPFDVMRVDVSIVVVVDLQHKQAKRGWTSRRGLAPRHPPARPAAPRLAGQRGPSPVQAGAAPAPQMLRTGSRLTSWKILVRSALSAASRPVMMSVDWHAQPLASWRLP